MVLSAFDIQKGATDTTDAGIDLVVDSISSPAGSVGVTKIMFGLAGANDGLVDSTTPLPVEIFDVAGTLNADVTAIRTAVETLDNAIAGSEMQVDVVGALPAGTNAIGKLAANSGVDIGDVDVLTIANMHSADYDSGGGTDTTLAVGIAVPASGGAAVIPGDATAGLKVDLGADNDVTNTGTFAVQEDGAALTSLQLIDDVVFTDDTSTHATGTTKGVGIMAAATPTDGSVGANDIGMVGMSLDRRLHVDAQIVGTDSALDVSGATVTVDSELPAAAALADNTSNPTVPGVGSFLMGWDGATWDRIRGDATNGVLVNLGTNNDVTVTGTVDLGATDNAVLDAIQSAVETIDNAIAGSEMQVDIVSAPTLTVDLGANNDVTIDNSSIVATEDAPAAANPDGIHVVAVRDDEVGSTAVTNADGDVSALRADRFGALKTTQLPEATSEIKFAVIDDAVSGDNTLVAAAGAGIKIRVLSAFLMSAGTVNCRFESGAGGTAITGQMNLVANTGFVLPFNPGGWFETADNALLNLELSAAVSVDGCLSYVEI